MGVGDERRLYEGPPHEWRPPVAGRTTSFILFGFTAWVVGVELFFVVGELIVNGFVVPGTARGFAAVGIICLVVANVKSFALPLHRAASDTLSGLMDIVMSRLWLAHFWLNPLGLFSLGLFLVWAPRAQPPFYYIAYGVLLWQAFSGLMGREAVPLRGNRQAIGRQARAAHHQPAVFVLLAILVAAGFVDSLFP